MARWSQLAAVVVVAPTLGCISMGAAQLADTVGDGRTQVAGEAGFYGMLATGGASAVPFVGYPDVGLTVRHGMTDWIDLGGSLSTSGVGVNAKFLLTDPSSRTLAISIAPEAHLMVAFAGVALGVTSASLPILFGLKTSGGDQFVFGPRLYNLLFFGGGFGAIDLVALGGNIGYAFRIGDDFALMPQADLLAAVAGGAPGTSGVVSFLGARAGAFLFTVKLGFLWGLRPVEPVESPGVPPELDKAEWKDGAPSGPPPSAPQQ